MKKLRSITVPVPYVAMLSQLRALSFLLSFLLPPSSFLLSSCNPDKGNYDYVPINEVQFQNINEEYSVITNATLLAIDPVITMSEGVSPDDDRFSYQWLCVAQNGEKYQIATTRAINTLVNLPVGTYNLYLKVRDSLTDLLWMAHTRLTVGTVYTRGILLIGEDEDGYADAQMISFAARRPYRCRCRTTSHQRRRNSRR